MESVTLSIAVIVSLSVFLVRPVWSLVLYCAVLVYYPTYLTLKVGSFDFSVPRIVIIAIFANLFLRTALLRQFKSIWLDKALIFYFVAQIFSGTMTNPSLGAFLENRAGAISDVVLPYFAVRLIITDRTQYLSLLRGFLLLVAPLACLGLYESITGHCLFAFAREFAAWQSWQKPYEGRFGFHRAYFAFSQPIMFGMFFAIVGPMCAGLLRQRRKATLIYAAGIAMAAVGVFSSMSNGPLVGAILAAAFILAYPYKRLWKPAVATFLLMCLLVEVISNRHFYFPLTRFTFNPSTAWYRAKLLDVALFEGGMSGHWLTGYGQGDPGWGAKIDGRSTVDIVNHYLLILYKFGLAGLVPYLVVLAAAARRLADAFKASTSKADQWLIWCLAGAFFGVLCAMFSVSLFGQPVNVFYMILGLCAVMPELQTKPVPFLYSTAKK